MAAFAARTEGGYYPSRSRTLAGKLTVDQCFTASIAHLEKRGTLDMRSTWSIAKLFGLLGVLLVGAIAGHGTFTPIGYIANDGNRCTLDGMCTLSFTLCNPQDNSARCANPSGVARYRYWWN